MPSYLGPFELLASLGAGPESDSWHSRRDDGREYLLKLSRSAEATSEFELLSELEHPAIPRVRDCGRIGHRFWFATDWVEGRTLERGWSAANDPAPFAAAALHALHYLHACGIVHGDVHPGNLMIASSGLPARLLDFDLASRGQSDPAGRDGFIAPEVRSGSPRSPASDVYGLAASLRFRGAEQARDVRAFVDAGLSLDPVVRLRAAADFAANHDRPPCGARVAGRQPEWEALVHALDGADARPEALLLRGSAGMGKSALLSRLALHARSRGWTVSTRADERFADLLVRWLDMPRPLLVVLDDLDRLGAEFVEATRRAAERMLSSGEKRFVLAASSTGDLAWPGRSMELGVLPAPEIARIFREITGAAPLAPDEAQLLRERSGGNPGLAGAIARSAVATRALVYRMGEWRLGPAAATAVPADAAEAARRELAGLTGGERRLLAAVALAEGVVGISDLEEVSRAPKDARERLLHLDVLRMDTGVPLVRDAAVGGEAVRGIEDAPKGQLHLGIAEKLRLAGGNEAAFALHVLRGGKLEEGVLAATSASRRAFARGRSSQARNLMEEASALVPQDHPEAWRFEYLALWLLSQERTDAGIAKIAADRATARGSRTERQSFGRLALHIQSRLRMWNEMEVLADRLRSLGVDCDDRVEQARAIRARDEGRVADAKAYLLRIGEERMLGADWYLAAHLAQAEGRIREAAKCALRACRVSGVDDLVFTQWLSWAAAAAQYLLQVGRFGLSQRVLAHARRSALRMGLKSPNLTFASVELKLGRVTRALVAASDWERTARMTGELDQPTGRLACLGLSQIARWGGSASEARRALNHAAAALPKGYQPWCDLSRVLLMMDEGELRAASAASAHFGAGDPIWRAPAQLLGAEALEAAGRFEEVRRLLGGLRESDFQDAGPRIVLASLSGRDKLRLGRRQEALEAFRRAIAYSAGDAPSGAEHGAKNVLALVGSGCRGEARDLLAALPVVSGSPVVDTAIACAGAVLERSALAGWRRLQSVAGKVAAAPALWRLTWYGLAAAWVPRRGQGDQRRRYLDLLAQERERLRSRNGDFLDPNRFEEKSMETVMSQGAQARRVQEIVREINSERNLGRLLDKILETALSVSGAERGCVVLMEKEVPVVRASRQLGSSEGGADTFSSTISNDVIQSGTAFLSGDAGSDDRVEGAMSVRALTIRSVACFPFRLRGRIIGTFYLDHRSRPDMFDPEVVDTLQTLANLAAVAIENAQLFEENERARKSSEEESSRLREKLKQVEIQAERESEAALRHSYPSIVGRGAAMLRMLRSVDRAAEIPMPVLIQGETGTGKELVARAIHVHGTHKAGPYIAENCAAISPGLMESELFGHVKGAFTGAVADHEGLFRRAAGGVLFLDEIGELDLPMQAKLLRAIEERQVRPVGSDRNYEVTCRIVAASNRNLAALVDLKRFREDLYYRLSSLRVEVPALKDRVEDLPALIKRFLSRLGDYSIDPEALRTLMATPWPGNVRQLRNFVEVLAATSSSRITEADVQKLLEQEKRLTSDAYPETLEAAVTRFREQRVREALASCGGELAPAARRLKITYQGLRRLFIKFNLQKAFPQSDVGRVKSRSKGGSGRKSPG